VVESGDATEVINHPWDDYTRRLLEAIPQPNHRPEIDAAPGELTSSWTVTLHHQAVTTLADGLAVVGRTGWADRLRGDAAVIAGELAEHLMPTSEDDGPEGVVAGYAHFCDGRPTHYLPWSAARSRWRAAGAATPAAQGFWCGWSGRACSGCASARTGWKSTRC
jgi:hypothetical protein